MNWFLRDGDANIGNFFGQANISKGIAPRTIAEGIPIRSALNKMQIDLYRITVASHPYSREKVKTQLIISIIISSGQNYISRPFWC